MFVSVGDLGPDGTLSFSEFAAVLSKDSTVGGSISDRSMNDATAIGKSECYIGRMKCLLFAVIVSCAVLISVIPVVMIICCCTRNNKETVTGENNNKGKEAEVSTCRGRRLSGDGGLYVTLDPTAGM